MLLIKPTEQTPRFITDLCICRLFLNSLCFPEFRLLPCSKMATNKGGGVGWRVIISMELTVQCQAEVGRGWLVAAWFLLRSLILKLSLTQQIPFSSPASLSSLFSPHFVQLICLSLFHLSPPHPKKQTQLYLSICLPEHEESKASAA